jgi:hypothetical protein
LISCESAWISLMDSGRVANGPSMTVTDSPISKSALGLDDLLLLLLLGREELQDLVDGQRRGRWVWPTKPVTPGVLRTADHDSSVRSMRTRT